MREEQISIVPSKEKALNKFVSKLQNLLGDKILAVHLFGSIAKGTAEPNSDIDVLVVYRDMDEDVLMNIANEVAFNIMLENSEFIEFVLMSEQEYIQGIGRSPFLWEVIKFGRPIFSKLSATEWILEYKGYLELAIEYLNYANSAVRRNEIRLSIDAAYNAAELLTKALIISSQNSLASTHSGIVTQFCKLFILTGQIDSQIGKDLNLCLELRAKARYKYHAQLSHKDAEFVISLAEKLLEISKKLLKQ